MNSLRAILIFAVRIYRWVFSPAKLFLFGPASRCRFTPSCSAYMIESLRQHGVFAGGWLGLKRIGRCHPWGSCGHDPVPDRGAARTGTKGLCKNYFRFCKGPKPMAAIESDQIIFRPG